MDELIREFVIESQEGLDRMERCLTDLESKPSDAGLLADIFRSVHTIKGTTGFLGFKRLEKLAHAGEDLLGMLREGTVSATGDRISALLTLLDALRSIVGEIEVSGEESEAADTAADELLVERLRMLQPTGASAGRKAGTRKPRGKSQAIGAQRKPRGKAASACATINLPHPTTPPIEPMAPVAQLEAAAAPEVGQGKDEPAHTSVSSAAESTLRVDITLLNRMMNLVGELVLTRNQLLQATAADARMTMLSRRLDMVTADLREAVMKARMQPVSNLFSKMPRMVRDLSQTLGRMVRLEMEGQETELDKSLLEAIKDPLTHAVRNALDHGIEKPEQRAACGKDPEGKLRLRAVQEGSHVIIEVSDDGAGIAVDRVRDKAIERGLITRERAAQAAERELLQMIFVPGFSTAAQVTNVSGRGVGMDVVRTNVEKIGGTVEIESRVGCGTTLRLRIPLTLAIIPALIVRSLGQNFALPQGALSELVHIFAEQSAKAIEWMENAPLYRLRGRLLPLVFLDKLLVPGSAPMMSNRDQFIAVLDADGRRFGLVVDGLADPEEIVVKPLSPVLKEIGIFSGATVLGNADLALILDPGAIAARAAVKVQHDEETAIDASAEETSHVDYLVLMLAGRQAAVALSDVLRIEQVPASRIEYVGSRPVLNFGGQLLTVEDPGGLISAVAPETNIVVVVCRQGERQIGIAVEQVLDVAAGSDLFESGGREPAEGVKLLRERVTDVVSLAGVIPLQLADEQAETAMAMERECV